MQWIMEILGLGNSVKAKRKKIAGLQQKAFEAQRNGNLRLAGSYQKQAEILEMEVEVLLKGGSSDT